MQDTEKNSKVVRIDRTLLANLEGIKGRFDCKTVDDLLKLFMKPIVTEIFKTGYGKVNVEIVHSGTEHSLTFEFTLKEKWFIDPKGKVVK